MKYTYEVIKDGDLVARGNTLKEARRYAKELGGHVRKIVSRNPGPPGAAFKRCVKSVEKRGGAYDPRAVCAAAGRKKYGAKTYQEMAAAGRRRAARTNPLDRKWFAAGKKAREQGHYAYWLDAWTDRYAYSQAVKSMKTQAYLDAESDFRTGFNSAISLRPVSKKRSNPPEAAVEAYEDFHGRQPDEMVEVTKQVHYHKHLAGAGKLEKLEVVSRRGDKVILSKFNGALLAFNEKRTQLFVEGGDQKVNLRDFGISSPHEMEVLGEVTAVEYFTRKDHLGKDGGTAIYRHKFSKPYPELQYDVVNEQLIFSGGNYVILAEGIDR